MAKFVDTHFHLDMYKNYNELFNYINEHEQYTLCMTNSPGVFYSCMNMFEQSKYIKFAIGFHPLNSNLRKKDMNDFIKLLPKTEYVGEIGLDFSKKNGLEYNDQIVFFDTIVKESAKNNKLMSIHIRKAEKEAFSIIDKYKPKRCIIHWYSGSIEYQKKFEDIGCYFSINANMMNNFDLIKELSTDRILIESDGPYSNVNGKKYRPQLLEAEYEYISNSLGISNLKEIVYSNFYKLLSDK